MQVKYKDSVNCINQAFIHNLFCKTTPGSEFFKPFFITDAVKHKAKKTSR